MDRLRVVHVRVGEPPAIVEIDHTTAEMQRLVGGKLDCVAVAPDIDIWCNDEALLVDEPKLNQIVPTFMGAVRIYGDLFVARHDGQGGTISLTDEDIAELFPS